MGGSGTLAGVAALADGAGPAGPDDVSDLGSANPGRDVQKIGTAAFLGQDVRKVHDPLWVLLGTSVTASAIWVPGEGGGSPGRDVAPHRQ
jgi:hypothetical protein